jgi:type I restriction enzyme M protein
VKHYENRVNDWFVNALEKNSVFEDEHLIDKYCEHQEIDKEDYISFLEGNPNDSLLDK